MQLAHRDPSLTVGGVLCHAVSVTTDPWPTRRCRRPDIRAYVGRAAASSVGHLTEACDESGCPALPDRPRPRLRPMARASAAIVKGARSGTARADPIPLRANRFRQTDARAPRLPPAKPDVTPKTGINRRGHDAIRFSRTTGAAKAAAQTRRRPAHRGRDRSLAQRKFRMRDASERSGSDRDGDTLILAALPAPPRTTRSIIGNSARIPPAFHHERLPRQDFGFGAVGKQTDAAASDVPMARMIIDLHESESGRDQHVLKSASTGNFRHKVLPGGSGCHAQRRGRRGHP